MRKQVRDAVKEALEKLDGFNRGAVAVGRRHKVDADQLPSVVIFTDSEQSERITMNPVKLMHEVGLVVRLTVKPDGVDHGEDKADALLNQIDTAVLAAVQDVDGIFDIVQVSLKFEGDGESDADYLQADRTYSVRYITAA